LDANLGGGEYLEELALKFDGADNDDAQKGRAILENLKPNENLRGLTIRNYVVTIFPSWLDNQCQVYSNLTFLHPSGCRYCSYVPPVA